LEASNNIAPQRGYNETITQLYIMNQWMDQMATEFEDKLERQHINDHGMVQINLE
jgi:hypothetical protein